MQNVLIVGYGVVGKNLSEEYKALKPEVYDKYKGIDTRTHDVYDIAFICVDTPYIDEETPCDITEVKNALNEYKSKVYVIKSTIPVGTTDKLVKETGKEIIFSPEYYGGTQHANSPTYNFTILGGNKQTSTKVIQALQNVYVGSHQFRMSDAKTAELTKYMENSWIATKVSFMQSFWNICQQEGLHYEEVRELFLLDPRVNPSHTFVYSEHPYWSSHCLNKDVPAIAIQYNNELLKSIIDFNKKQKRKHQ